MTSPMFTPEQWQAIVSLFESRWDRPGSSNDFSQSIQLARQAITKFEQYFETLSPQLIGADKQALFTIKNDFTDIRHATYQIVGQMEVRYRRFKLQPTTSLIEHLNMKKDERSFKDLIEQNQVLQSKLTQFHSTHFWCEINKWGIISSVIGTALIIFGRILVVLLPETRLNIAIYIVGTSLLLIGLTAVGLTKFQEHGRDCTMTMRYLEEIHKQIDKIRFQFDDLRACIAEDTAHEIMQNELDVTIESIRELKLLCFP
jgi:3D (Asp-Asp-Asp) domain-containing protein